MHECVIKVWDECSSGLEVYTEPVPLEKKGGKKGPSGDGGNILMVTNREVVGFVDEKLANP